MKRLGTENEFFGPLDDVWVQRSLVKHLHVSKSFEQRLKIDDKDRGRCILVGPKGFGKTHLRRIIEVENEDAVSVYFNEDENSFDLNAAEICGTSGRIKNSLQIYILAKITEQLTQTSQLDFNSFIGMLENLLRHARRAGTSGSLSLDFGGISLDIGKLFGPAVAPTPGWRVERMLNGFKTALQGRKIFITIDDLDEIFLDIGDHPNVIEGMARAVSDLNSRLGSDGHVFLFMKISLWLKWYFNKFDYDKVSSQIDFISWSERDSVELIARRAIIYQTSNFDPVEGAVGDSDFQILGSIKNENVLYQVWNQFFDFGDTNSWRSKIHKMHSYCRSGPRDFIKLCNLSKEYAGGDRIKFSHVESILPEFSSEKLTDIGGEYTNIFPGLESFLRASLSGVQGRITFDELKVRIQDLSADDVFRSDLRQQQWFRNSSASEKIKYLYDTGSIGVLSEAGDVTYSFLHPDIAISQLSKAALCPHPALQLELANS